MVHLETRKQHLFQLSKTWKRGVLYRFQTNVTRLFQLLPPPPPKKKVQIQFLGMMNQPLVRNSETCLFQYINQNDMKQQRKLWHLQFINWLTTSTINYTKQNPVWETRSQTAGQKIHYHLRNWTEACSQEPTERFTHWCQDMLRLFQFMLTLC
jgi:hypothetical protein